MAHVKVIWQIQQFICYFTAVALFYFVFEGNFQVQASRDDLKEGFLPYEFVWEAYTWKGKLSEFYGMFFVDFSKNYRGMTDLKRKNSSLSYVMLYFQQNTANQMRSK